MFPVYVVMYVYVWECNLFELITQLDLALPVHNCVLLWLLSLLNLCNYNAVLLLRRLGAPIQLWACLHVCLCVCKFSFVWKKTFFFVCVSSSLLRVFRLLCLQRVFALCWRANLRHRRMAHCIIKYFPVWRCSDSAY